jgi:hypothetical protein
MTLGLLHWTVDLLLGAIGGADKAIKAREFAQETHQAHATGTHCSAYQMSPKDQAMEEGQTWATGQKGHDGGMCVKTFLIGPPGRKRAAGNRKRLGGLTQGEPLGVPSKRLIEECSASGAIPSWAAMVMAAWLGLDDGSHSDLLGGSFAFVSAWLRMARSPPRVHPSPY